MQPPPPQQQQNGQPESQPQQQPHYHHHHQESQSDNEFLEQILSTFPNCSWPPNPHELPSPTSNGNPNSNSNPNPNIALKPGDSTSDAFHHHYPFDEASLVNKLSQQQMNEVTAKSALLQHQQQFLHSRRAHGDPTVQALFNGFGGGLDGGAQLASQQHFHPPPPPPPQDGSMGGGQGGGMNEGAPPTSASTGGSNGAGGAPRQRVRARRGQATDPHSIAERLRRERIAERMKSLQELVPNANKTDKASMLDEIIDYVKFLQLQVKVLSMSRLGGAGRPSAAGAPLVADMNSEDGVGRNTNGAPKTSVNDNGMTVTEHQVAKLMEEDMGSAMQYLQGKGLCLMPISLATAISTATSLSRTPLPPPRPPHLNNHHNDNDNNNNNHDGNNGPPTSD